jgi:Pyruvate/2-oxoacid:ferredoxin oxidoreductase delta subunit/predicted transcriptional regulator
MDEKTPWQELAEGIGVGDSKLMPAIFEALTDEAEARLLLAAAPPASVGEIAERSGLDEAAAEAMIDALFRKGLLFKSRKQDGTRYYRVRNVLQFHDATAVALDPPPEAIRLWKQYMQTEWHDYSSKLDAALPGSVLRVIPVNVSIEPNNQILAFEDVSQIVDAARRLAVTRCSCRVIDGACGQPLDVCLQIDRAADYAIERGTGRELTKAETLQILQDCEYEGLVHVAQNTRGLGHVICNCCSDCCLNWTSIRHGTGKFIAPSRFRAVVQPEDCTGCELCIDRCFFEALSMDQEDRLAVVESKSCMGCGVCQVICPTEAVVMREARPESFVPA